MNKCIKRTNASEDTTLKRAGQDLLEKYKARANVPVWKMKNKCRRNLNKNKNIKRIEEAKG
jgi:hypothetical protein